MVSFPVGSADGEQCANGCVEDTPGIRPSWGRIYGAGSQVEVQLELLITAYLWRSTIRDIASSSSTYLGCPSENS